MIVVAVAVIVVLSIFAVVVVAVAVAAVVAIVIAVVAVVVATCYIKHLNLPSKLNKTRFSAISAILEKGRIQRMKQIAVVGCCCTILVADD